MSAVAVESPADIPGLVEGYDVIGVDEVQFFPREITLVLDGYPAPADGATIVVGALDSYEARCRSCHVVSAPALDRVG